MGKGRAGHGGGVTGKNLKRLVFLPIAREGTPGANLRHFVATPSGPWPRGIRRYEIS
jgi:hypothetical protein